MQCKVFDYAYDFRDMEKEINQWFKDNKHVEIVSVFQQGGVQSGEDPGATLSIVTTIFYRE